MDRVRDNGAQVITRFLGDISPRNPESASIRGGLDSPGEFNLTFGEIRHEHFGHKNNDERTLNDLRELLMATFKGRLFQKGKQATASGYALFSDGTKYKFGALDGWFGKLFKTEEPYPPYA